MKKLIRNRKAYTIGDIPYLAITLGVGIIVLSIVGQIVGEVGTEVKDATNASAPYNITVKGADGIEKFGNWLPTVGLILGAVIVIVALSVLFIFKKR